MDYKINKSIIASSHKDGGIILNTESGKYHELNATAMKLFKYIEDGVDIETMKNKLSTEYEINLDEAYKNIVDFIEILIKNGFVEKN